MYGKLALKPAFENIIIAKKPISEKTTKLNLLVHGTGTINIGRLRELRGDDRYPDTIFYHPKAKASEHGSPHPCVKPISLMVDLVALYCPVGETVLDPFAGSGTTGIAARNLGHPVVLIDNDPEMRSEIERRLRA